MKPMTSFTDAQLRIFLEAVTAVPVDRRSVFVERVAAMWKFRSHSDENLREQAIVSCLP